MTVMIGKNVDVNLYVLSEPKYAFIKWYSNTTLLSQSAKYSMLEKIMIVDDDFHGKIVQLDGYKLTLVINAVRIEDATFYRLLLSNGIGDVVEHIVFLEIGSKFNQNVWSKIGLSPEIYAIMSLVECGHLKSILHLAIFICQI